MVIYNREELLPPIGKGEIEEEGYHTYHCRKLDSFLFKKARSVTSKKNIPSTYLGGGLNLATKNSAKSVSSVGDLHFFALDDL